MRARRWSGWALALGAVLACAPAQAQEPGPWRAEAEREVMRYRAEERRPFELLLRNRDRLALSDAQVDRLEEIARRLDAANAPLREELRGEGERFLRERRERLERLTPEQRRDTLRRMRQEGRRPELPPRIRELMGEMRRNIARATGLAQDVLTPEQKRRARMLLREHRRERRERGGMGPGPRGPHGSPQGPPGPP